MYLYDIYIKYMCTYIGPVVSIVGAFMNKYYLQLGLTCLDQWDNHMCSAFERLRDTEFFGIVL